MAVSICLKIGKGPNIAGESQKDKHLGWIDVLDWSWGIEQSGTAQYSTGAGMGSANVHDLTITKRVDLATPNLYTACHEATNLETVTMDVLKASGKDPLPYLVITLSGTVIVSSIRTGAKQPDDSFTEVVTFNFSDVTIEYTPQTAVQGKGGTVSRPIHVTKK